MPELELPSFILFAQEKMGDDTDHQLRIIKAITTGLDQRGLKALVALQEWAITLATRFIKNIPTEESGWTVEAKMQQQYAAEIAGRYRVATMGPSLKSILTSKLSSNDATRAVAASSLMSISASQYTGVVANVLTDGDETPWMRQRAA